MSLPAPAITDGAARTTALSALWPRRTPVIMGILNCTPDSFSDGGRFVNPDAAVDHGLRLIEAGADLIDIGGESARPGASPVPAAMEMDRVIPVIEALRRDAPGVLLSIDTSKPDVAGAALDAGAVLVNDVTGARSPDMLPTVVSRGAGIVLMHMQGRPRTMQDEPLQGHVVAEVHGFLRRKAGEAVAAGIDPGAVWLDPGIGFGKDDAANLQLLAAVADLGTLGHPVVIGASRKSMIGRLTGADVDARLPGSLAAIVPTLEVSRSVVRVHDPGPTRQFLDVLAAVREAGR